jgi:hypothetical protein
MVPNVPEPAFFSGTPFSGTPVSPEDLLLLADFLAPTDHFVADSHLAEAARNLATWADAHPNRLWVARDLAARRGERPTVVDVLHRAGLESLPDSEATGRAS